MKDAITVTGDTVRGQAIVRLLFTDGFLADSPECQTAYKTITEEAELCYETAFYLSGGADSASASAAGMTNALHGVAPQIVAYALHHLGELLPDLTPEQWARLDAAGTVLSLRLREDLTGANTVSPLDKAPQSGEPLSGPACGVSGELW